jgi:phosphoserine phosphatase
VAAFFDLDGTLMPLPSLERRFFRRLRERGEIPLNNYFLWLGEAVRLLSCGAGMVAHANKRYLKGVESLDESGWGNRGSSLVDQGGKPSEPRAEGQASTPPKRNPRWPVPLFFEASVERVAWHGRQGHALVILSGTLEPLARVAARGLQAELAARGVAANILVRATTLSEIDGRWTGQILGRAMFGKEKARAVGALAEGMGLDLSACWAYADSEADRWMLDAVGKPAAVNPEPQLARIARQRGWPILHTTNPPERHEALCHAERRA